MLTPNPNSIPEPNLPSAVKSAGEGRHLFGPHQRLRKGLDFERVFRRKCKAADGKLLVFIDANGSTVSRLGLSVSRKQGNAVVRGRLKRWLREAFRLEQHHIPAGIDIVCIPLDQSLANLATYRASLKGLTAKLWRRFQAGSKPTV